MNATIPGCQGQPWHALTATDFRLLEYLQFLNRQYGKVFPSQETLSKHLKVSVRTARRSIAHLKELGLLLVQPRRFRNALGRVRSQSNVYKLCTVIGAKVRGILSRLTGRTRAASVNKTRKKEELSDVIYKREEINHPTLRASLDSLEMKVKARYVS